jgi:hypothetical protein
MFNKGVFDAMAKKYLEEAIFSIQSLEGVLLVRGMYIFVLTVLLFRTFS